MSGPFSNNDIDRLIDLFDQDCVPMQVKVLILRRFLAHFLKRFRGKLSDCAGTVFEKLLAHLETEPSTGVNESFAKYSTHYRKLFWDKLSKNPNLEFVWIHHLLLFLFFEGQSDHKPDNDVYFVAGLGCEMLENLGIEINDMMIKMSELIACEIKTGTIPQCMSISEIQKTQRSE